MISLLRYALVSPYFRADVQMQQVAYLRDGVKQLVTSVSRPLRSFAIASFVLRNIPVSSVSCVDGSEGSEG